MKKALTVFFSLLFIASLCFGSFAAGGNAGKSAGNASGSITGTDLSPAELRRQKIEERRAQNALKMAAIDNKQQEFQAFREQLQSLRKEMIENRQRSVLYAAETNRLRLKLLQQINALYRSGANLPKEVVAALEEYTGRITATMAELKTTKGDIQDILKKNRNLMRNRDYAAMDAAFAEISEIQKLRYEQLTKINTILQQMNALIESLPPAETTAAVTTAP